jgi:hypothetical protein
MDRDAEESIICRPVRHHEQIIRQRPQAFDDPHDQRAAQEGHQRLVPSHAFRSSTGQDRY